VIGYVETPGNKRWGSLFFEFCKPAVGTEFLACIRTGSQIPEHVSLPWQLVTKIDQNREEMLKCCLKKMLLNLRLSDMGT
jgi:hypothetical protein